MDEQAAACHDRGAAGRRLQRCALCLAPTLCFAGRAHGPPGGGRVFAGPFFVQKCTSGVGIFLVGAILAIAGFSEKAIAGQVPVATIDRLTLTFGITYLIIAALAALCFSRFPFGRAEHDARLARLSAETI